jgi:hypothetical protein
LPVADAGWRISVVPVEYKDGPGPFLKALDEYGLRDRSSVQAVVNWALWLGDAGLANLRSTIGIESRALRVELLGKDRAMVMLWRKKRGVTTGLEGSLIFRHAPFSAPLIEREIAPKRLSRVAANAIGANVTPELLYALTAAYAEAGPRQGQARGVSQTGCTAGS